MLPPDKVAQTTTFKENKEWIEKIRDSGATVLDLGNPNGLNTSSSFYDMETSILWKN